MESESGPKVIEKKDMDEYFEGEMNEAISIFDIEENIQVGVLTLEPETRLPAEGMSEHEHSHEFSYVIEGEVILGTDSGEKKIKKGELMYNKPGTSHYTINRSSDPAKVLWFLSPPME